MTDAFSTGLSNWFFTSTLRMLFWGSATREMAAATVRTRSREIGCIALGSLPLILALIRQRSPTVGLVLNIQALQIIPERSSQIGACEREFNGCFQESQFVPGVEAPTVELQAENRAVPEHILQCVGEL